MVSVHSDPIMPVQTRAQAAKAKKARSIGINHLPNEILEQILGHTLEVQHHVKLDTYYHGVPAPAAVCERWCIIAFHAPWKAVRRGTDKKPHSRFEDNARSEWDLAARQGIFWYLTEAVHGEGVERTVTLVAVVSRIKDLCGRAKHIILETRKAV